MNFISTISIKICYNLYKHVLTFVLNVYVKKYNISLQKCELKFLIGKKKYYHNCTKYLQTLNRITC